MRRVSESYREELSSNSSTSLLIRSARSSENLQQGSCPLPCNPKAETESLSSSGPFFPERGENFVSRRKNSNGTEVSSRHIRGMSDPFDSQRMIMMDAALSSESIQIAAERNAGIMKMSTTSTTQTIHNDTAVEPDTDEYWHQRLREDSAPLPTLPRYPVAATKNSNCWSETDISKFSVRGESYLFNKKKIPSDAYLLPARGADLLLFDETITDYADPTTPLPVEKFLNGKLLKQPTLAIVFRFPWGCMNQYFQLPDMYLPFLKNNPPIDYHPSSVAEFSPAQKCLAQWLASSPDEKNASLKLIALVDEGPFLVRQLVTGRPVLIGTKLALTYQILGEQNNVLMCELNIGSGSATAKRIVSVCRRYMNSLTVDLGWLIQAETKEHLPETMMGSIRLHHPDALTAPKLTKVTSTITTDRDSAK